MLNVEQISDVIEECLFEPKFFLEDIVASDYDHWQLELLEAIADIDRIRYGIPTRYNHEGLTRISVVSCHGTGKTTGAALAMHWYQFTHRARIPCTAPKEKQLKTRLWPAFRGLRSSAPDGYKELMEVSGTSITWMGDENWAAIIETASVPENLAGYHPTPDIPDLMFIVEEASGVSDALIQVAEGALSTEGAILLMISNPTRTQGEFYRSHNTRGVKEQYYRIHVHPDNSKYVSKKWVENMIKKWGKDSPVVKIRCLGLFCDVSENQLLTMEWLEKAYVDEMPLPDGSFPHIRVTVDVADGGEDKTVISVFKRYDSFDVMIKQRAYSFPTARASIMSAEKAEELFLEAGGSKDDDDFVVDSLGVGTGTAGTLIKKGYRVVIYKGGAGSDDMEKWRNRRTQSYMCYRDALRDGNLFIMEDAFEDRTDREDFEGACLSIQTRPGAEKIEELVTKQSMKNQGIKSPDHSDSVAMNYATEEPMQMSPEDWEQEYDLATSQAVEDW